MSIKPDGPRFIFHGNAVPFGGRIEAINGQPHFELIKGPPASSLSVVGGWSIATSRGSNHGDSFRWGASVADCKGEYRSSDGHHTTTVACSIADVVAKNDPHVFEADEIRIKMASDHAGPEKQAIIAPKEIHFGDLRLDGAAIKVIYDQDLTDFPTLALFEWEYQNNPAFFNKYQPSLRQPSGQAKFGDPLPRTGSGFVLTTFVRSLVWRDQTFQGNVLTLKGFGRIHFGEVLLNADNRRVTMVRLEMGCPLQAQATAGGADPNGTWA